MKLDLLVAACAVTVMLTACGGGSDDSKNTSAGRNLPLVRVTDTEVQAVPNTAYLADKPTQVLVNLPAQPAIGDVIRVSGGAAGGWVISQNADQSIVTGNVPQLTGAMGSIFTPRATGQDWSLVAVSDDATRMVAAKYGGYIHTSADSGVHWTPRTTSGEGKWSSFASSASGDRLVAVEWNGRIHTSKDYGDTWTPHEEQRFWKSVASSSTGQYLVAAAYLGDVYLSSDYGDTWVVPAPMAGVWDVTSSSTGQHMAAASANGAIWTSGDHGASWAQQLPEVPEGGRVWISLAASANGQRLVGTTLDGLYTSEDFGANWTRQLAGADWLGVASSADGRSLVAGQVIGVEASGQVYTSENYGKTWQARGPSRADTNPVISADGQTIVAIASNFHQRNIYTSGVTSAAPLPSTSIGVTGAVGGGQSDTIELQYVGNGKFIVLSSTGTFEIR